MEAKKLNIIIEQLKRVHRDINECANKFILKDAIEALSEVAPKEETCDCVIPKPKDAYGYDKDYCRDCEGFINHEEKPPFNIDINRHEDLKD